MLVNLCMGDVASSLSSKVLVHEETFVPYVLDLQGCAEPAICLFMNPVDYDLTGQPPRYVSPYSLDVIFDFVNVPF
jgi:hypothetical protein